MELIPFYGHGFEANSYLVVADRQALLIDAGFNADAIKEVLAEKRLSLTHILLTHGHFDHILSMDRLRRDTQALVAIHAADAEMLTDAEKNAEAALLGTHTPHDAADLLLSGKQELSFGNTSLRVLHTPGHSRGSVCYLLDRWLFTGDTLFNGSFGRYDLYGGGLKTIVASLRGLRALDPTLTIYPGHGSATTLGNALDLLFDQR